MDKISATTATVGEDCSVTLPDWVIQGLQLTEGDEIEFVRLPGEDGFVLEKIAKSRDAVDSTGPITQQSP